MKLKLVSFFAFFCFLSCKNEKDIDSLRVVRKNINQDLFIVKLTVEVEKDDTFSLYYTTDGSTNFKDNPIWIDVKGNNSLQTVSYMLPKGVLPTQLRLDFGMNQDQDDIILHHLEMEYKGQSRKIEAVALHTYFRADESKCNFEMSSNKIIAKVIDGKRQFPSLYPHEAILQPEIEKLIK